MRYTLALAAVLALAGCNSGPSLVGTWDVSGLSDMPSGAKTTMTFAAPDKMTMVVKSDLPIPSAKASMTATIHGTYAQKGDALTLKAETANLKFDGLPAQMQALADQNAEQGKQQMLDQINKSPESKIAWEGTDKVTVSGSGQTMTMTRQKG